MEKEPQEQRPQQPGPRPLLRGPNLLLLLLVLAVVALVLFWTRGPKRSLIDYDFFLAQLAKDNISRVEISEDEAYGFFKQPPLDPGRIGSDGKVTYEKKDKDGNPLALEQQFRVQLPPGNESQARLIELLEEKRKKEGISYAIRPKTDNSLILFYAIAIGLPLALLLFMWLSLRRTRNELMGGGFLSGFSKSPARRYEATKQHTTFKDVAGLEGVKQDLMELVEFLKSPQKFQRLGGRVPKGVLLNGPPGTGKTLLARAVAGEAGVPFFSVSGSEFIQMFVGVGASRVRDLFKVAKDNAPSIIFIDEIDAVGRQRGAGLGGGHDEREQTLNQILNEMDGFTQTDSVIVLAATNRPDVLDPALLRPGRFDRHVTVDRPTKKGRLEIFKVHVRDVPLADDVDLESMASATVGLTGADIRNIVNEAALWAARHNKTKVEREDFEYARDKVLMGAKRDEVLREDEKRKTAYHEAGHALLAWTLPGAHRVHKVTIIPRGHTLGATQMLPSDDRFNLSEHELRDNLIVLLGGRAAERLLYNETTVGAENDLERASGLARRMVTHWGMSQRLGPVSYKMSDDDPFLGREIHQHRQFSEHTMELIDLEVGRILHEADERAMSLLAENRDKLERLVENLVRQEELDEQKIAELIGPSAQSQNDSNGQPDGKSPSRSSRAPSHAAEQHKAD